MKIDKPVINNVQITVNFPHFRRYQNIISRCYNPLNKRFKDYGKRGIKVQNNWINNFENFYNYIIQLPNYDVKNSLDRINNDIGYFEGNLRWVNRSIQSINRRKPKNNTTGLKGIQVRKKLKTFKVDISINKKRIYLGDFKTIEEALNKRNSYIIQNNLPHEIQTLNSKTNES